MEELHSRAVVQVIALLIAITVIIMLITRHQIARQQQVQGILWLQAMRVLITHVQRHRGLSSGILSGEFSLQTKLDEVQLQVSRDFDYVGEVGDWIIEHGGWQWITQHWARLAGNFHRLPVAQNIDQHNRLIKSILVFVDEIALAHHLGASSVPRAGIWRDLLSLAECIGQARAIGTAIAASGSDWDVDALTRARDDLQAVNQGILDTLEAPRCRSGLDGQNLQSILDFLAYIDLHVLREGSVVSASDFYTSATQTLDKLYERFDEELAEINSRLK